MKLTGKHKAYGVVVALGLGGLVADRLFLGATDGGVSSASAATAAPAPAGGAKALAPGGGAAATVAATAPADLVADDLARLGTERGYNVGTMADAFVPTSAWEIPKPKPADAPGVAAAPAAPAGPPPGTVFVANHRLSAVMSNPGGGGVAFVNQKPVRVGQTVDGFRLVEVSRRSAAFAADGVRVELTLAGEAGDADTP